MKKNIIKIFLLSLFLIIISYLIIIVNGNTYKVIFNTRKADNYKLLIEEKTGKIEVLDKKEMKDKYIIKVKNKKEGIVYLSLDYRDTQNIKRLYIHKNMVITEDGFLGKTTYSEIIPLSLSIILLYTLILLIKSYKKSIKENIYQYKNITYLGIIIFISFFIINNLLSFMNYQG